MNFLTSSRRKAAAVLIAVPLSVGLALAGATAAQAAVSYTLVTTTDDAGFPVLTYTFAPSSPEAAEAVFTYNGAMDTGVLEFNLPHDLRCVDGQWILDNTAPVTRIDMVGQTESGESGVTESIVLDPAICAVVPEPETTTPAVVVPPAETTAPVVAETAAPAAAEPAPRTLASTGLELPFLPLGITAAILALGALSVWIARPARSEGA